jgi:antitoxin VapB
MGMSIKNAEVEAMLRDLATKRGVTLTEALRQALSAELEREAEKLAERKKRIQAIIEDFQKLPVLDHRTPDEILGYDENGLPT